MPGPRSTSPKVQGSGEKAAARRAGVAPPRCVTTGGSVLVVQVRVVRAAPVRPVLQRRATVVAHGRRTAVSGPARMGAIASEAATVVGSEPAVAITAGAVAITPAK